MSDNGEIQIVAAAAMREFVNRRLEEAKKAEKDIKKEESFQAKRDAHAAAFEAVKAQIEPTFPLLEKEIADFIHERLYALVHEVPRTMLPAGPKPAVRLGEAKESRVFSAMTLENLKDGVCQSHGSVFAHAGVFDVVQSDGEIALPTNGGKEQDVSVVVETTSESIPPKGFLSLKKKCPNPTYVAEHKIDENGTLTETRLHIFGVNVLKMYGNKGILLNVQPVRDTASGQITGYSIACMSEEWKRLAMALAREVVDPAMLPAKVLARKDLIAKEALHIPRFG